MLCYIVSLFCQDQHGERCIQEANLRIPWYLGFRCMLLQKRPLAKNKLRLGLIKRASSQRNELMFNNTPARKTDRLLGVRKR